MAFQNQTFENHCHMLSLRSRIVLFATAFIIATAAFIAFSWCANSADASRERFSENIVPVEKLAGTLRIASLNCYNYLSTNRRTSDGKYKRHWPKPEAERKAMCDLVEMIRPDVLALQEIGGETQVQQFAEDLAQRGLVFSHRIVLKGRDISRRIAIISAFPFEKEFLFPERETISRGLLGVKISTGTRSKLAVFTVHLKSKITRDDSDPECAAERFREAKCVRSLIEKSGENRFVLLGDFNDVPNSPPVSLFSDDNFSVRQNPTDSHGNAWTYKNEKYGYENTFDQIFIAPALKDFIVPRSAKIAEPAISKRAGDHRMVYIDLLFEQ